MTFKSKIPYLCALPGMMENEAVWEIIKDRTLDKKDSFLSDRFMSAYHRCYDAIKSGSTHEEWCDIARTSDIEPALAQIAYETAKAAMRK